MNNKIALIIGVSGQDGSYLARYLLNKGYKVIGTSRDSALCNTKNLEKLNIQNDIKIISLSTLDFKNIITIINKFAPDHIYNLSGMTSVGLSYELPFECFNSISNSCLNILEALKITKSKARFFNAGSSECFGSIESEVASELTKFKPNSPYGVAKSSAFWLVSSYREAYGMYCCSGILGNHESPLRASRFVTQKIISNAKLIKEGKANTLFLGNLNTFRDWGWAPEYVEAMYLMLNNKLPKDYIIATGQSHSLYDFVQTTFKKLNLEIEKYLKIDNNLKRPNDIDRSILDPTKISNELGWKAKYELENIIEFMIENNYT